MSIYENMTKSVAEMRTLSARLTALGKIMATAEDLQPYDLIQVAVISDSRQYWPTCIDLSDVLSPSAHCSARRILQISEAIEKAGMAGVSRAARMEFAKAKKLMPFRLTYTAVGLN